MRSRAKSCCDRRRAVCMSVQSTVPDVLRGIIERKRTEVDELEQRVKEGSEEKIAAVLARRGDIERSRAFYKALDLPVGSLGVIAEIKRRSPSKGHIGEIKDPGLLSRTYYEGGANAISVLTDEEGFGGTMNDLESVAKTQESYRGNYPGPCPVLRKDFIIDEVQIAQAAAGGAKAVLLIVAALGKDRTKELLEATHGFGLDALVEVHDEEELEIAVDVGAEIIGVNNRDLRTFNVSLDTSLRLAPLFPQGVLRVAESGIEEGIDAWKLRDAGYNAVLVGESLVRGYEGSSMSGNAYTTGFNQAKGLIRAFKAKGSVEFGPTSSAAFFGKGEAASETLGEISI